MRTSSAAQGSRCPVCWSSVRPTARRCPSCQADLASGRGRVPAPPPTSRVVPHARGERGRARMGRWIAAAVVGVAALTGATLKVVRALLPPAAEYGAATGNVGPRIAVTRATAVRALLAFQPTGDVESVGTALAYATRDRPNLAGSGTAFAVRPGPGGSMVVTARLPVDVAFLRRVHAVRTRFGPNLSDLAAGRLYVNAADDNAYGIVMDPHTHVAVFSFRLSADDGSIWALNLNALQVVSQTQSLG
jgi:hypothetical protein